MELTKGIQFDTTYKYLWKFVNVKNFTNMMENGNEFVKQFREYLKLIDHYTGTEIKSLSNDGVHAHKIEESGEIDLIKKIMRAQYGNNNKAFEQKWQEIGVYDFWQLGITKIFRVVGILDENIFRMLIIDCYHMIYLNKNLHDPKVMKNSLSIL